MKMDILGRGVGRPLGSRDLHGKAKRFDQDRERDYRVAIARLVRDARLEQGISVAELAEAIGANPASIRKIERAAVRPLAATLCRIALALGLSPAELMPL